MTDTSETTAYDVAHLREVATALHLELPGPVADDAIPVILGAADEIERLRRELLVTLAAAKAGVPVTKLLETIAAHPKFQRLAGVVTDSGWAHLGAEETRWVVLRGTNETPQVNETPYVFPVPFIEIRVQSEATVGLAGAAATVLQAVEGLIEQARRDLGWTDGDRWTVSLSPRIETTETGVIVRVAIAGAAR